MSWMIASAGVLTILMKMNLPPSNAIAANANFCVVGINMILTSENVTMTMMYHHCYLVIHTKMIAMLMRRGVMMRRSQIG